MLGERSRKRGQAAEAAAQFQAAEDDFQKALGLAPNTQAHYALLVNRGVTRYRQGQLQEAAKGREEATWYAGESRQASGKLQEHIQTLEQQLQELQGRLQQVEHQFHDSQRSLAA